MIGLVLGIGVGLHILQNKVEPPMLDLVALVELAKLVLVGGSDL